VRCTWWIYLYVSIEIIHKEGSLICVRIYFNLRVVANSRYSYSETYQENSLFGTVFNDKCELEKGVLFNGPFSGYCYVAFVAGKIWVWSNGVIMLTGQKQSTRRRYCSKANLSSSNHTRSVLGLNRTTAVRGRRLTSWAGAQSVGVKWLINRST
jgi:hypothetical protein